MLLFTDGFECARPWDIIRKWGISNKYLQGQFITSDISGTGAKIVSGIDTSVSPAQVFARRPDGRAFYYDRTTSQPIGLRTYIRKSRTVFMGMGFRYRQTSSTLPEIVIKFYTRTFPGIKRRLEENIGNTYYPDYLVATCTFSIRGTYADTKWEFPSASCPDVFGQVNANKSICNGDWNYFQFGITLHGNNPDGAQAWVENRIGSNEADRIDNIFTAAPGSENSYFIDSVEIILNRYASYDDIYIANDEGSTNNDFLGPVHIRSVTPETQGSINQGQVVNTGEADRAQAVTADMIGTYETMPADPPDPTEDQHFVAWEDPREKYINLPRIGSTQTFDFQNPNFAGSEPVFFGAVAYMMVRPGSYDQGQTSIEPVMLNSLQEVEPTVPLRRPLTFLYENEWEIRRGVFENPDSLNQTGMLSETWNRTALSNAEFGVRVIRHEDDPDSYLPEFLRVQYTFDDLLTEGFNVIDAPERYWEEMMALTFAMESESTMDLTWAIYEAFEFLETGTTGVLGLQKYLNSILYTTDDIPWTFLTTWDQVSMDDMVQVTWAQTVDDALDIVDEGYDLWVEEVPDGLDLGDDAIFVFTLQALDSLAMDDPVTTNHELIEDGFQTDSSYIFSGHELIMETLYPDDGSSVGVLDIAEDGFNFEEEHYNGWYVAVVQEQHSITDDILTQHWRHEFVLGVVIRSWQVDPIEQEGDDGIRTGQLTSQYWESLGY